MRVSANGAFAYVDYILALSWGYRKEALIYSCFERSEMHHCGWVCQSFLLSFIPAGPCADEGDGVFFRGGR